MKRNNLRSNSFKRGMLQPVYTAPPTYEEWAINMGIQIDNDS